MEKLNCKSLMIGDWVSYGGTPIKVENVYEDCINFQHDIPFVQEEFFIEHTEIGPIPLTPEILEKNGFKLKPDGWLWCKEEGIEDKNYIFIQFRKGCDEVRLIELNFVNKALAKYKQIHYVHELQHALRLCGIEKKDIQL